MKLSFGAFDVCLSVVDEEEEAEVMKAILMYLKLLDYPPQLEFGAIGVN